MSWYPQSEMATNAHASSCPNDRCTFDHPDDSTLNVSLGYEAPWSVYSTHAFFEGNGPKRKTELESNTNRKGFMWRHVDILYAVVNMYEGTL